MEQLNNCERVIEYLQAIRVHPKMYFGCDDDPFIARAHLNGIRFIVLHLFSFKGSFVSLYDEAARRRGFWYHADGVIPALRKKGLDDVSIVNELIETEIEFWRVHHEGLVSECAE